MKETGKDIGLKFRVGIPRLEMAESIAAWTQEAGTMLPKSKQEISSLFNEDRSVVILGENDRLVGHAAITFIYFDGSVEIGGAITDENYRRQGIATLAVQEVLVKAAQSYPKGRIFALANDQSLPLFTELGGQEIACSELSDEVWEYCAGCPNRPIQKEGEGFKCCDTPIDLTEIAHQLLAQKEEP